jgi:hypothetical protein
VSGVIIRWDVMLPGVSTVRYYYCKRALTGDDSRSRPIHRNRPEEEEERGVVVVTLTLPLSVIDEFGMDSHLSMRMELLRSEQTACSSPH